MLGKADIQPATIALPKEDEKCEDDSAENKHILNIEKKNEQRKPVSDTAKFY